MPAINNSSGRLLAVFILAAHLCGGTRAPAQINEAPLSLWMDDYLIREHVKDDPFRALGYQGAEGVKWNGAAHRYTSLVPPLLRYKATERDCAHQVHVRHYFMGYDRYRWPRFSQMPAAAIAARLDTLAARLTMKDEQELRYNDDGYLLQRTRRHITGDSTISINDTLTFRYIYARDRSLDIDRTDASFERVSAAHVGSIYGSACCGNFNHGPFILRVQGSTHLHFDVRQLLTRSMGYNETYANDCRAYNCGGMDTLPHMLTYTYDSTGRLLTVADSSPVFRRQTAFTQYIYRPFYGYGWEGAVIRAPLLQQYLNTMRRPDAQTVSRSTYYWYGNGRLAPPDSPQVRTESMNGIWDEHHQLRLIFGKDVLNEKRVVAYRNGQDSAGAYHNATYLQDPAANEDNTTYRPTPYRDREEFRNGCIVRDYYRLPSGTMRSGPPGLSERIVSPREADGLQLVSYGQLSRVTGDEDIYFWAPQRFERYASRYASPDALIILDQHGRVQYYYEEGHIYLLAYE